MPIIRRKLDVNTVYPANLRYNPDTDTVQSLIGDEWVDNPDADPRRQTTLPPRMTASPACDAAQSVADAIQGQINGVIEAIDNASTLFTIAGIILSLFTFGTFGVFISLALGAADSMVGAGSAAIEAALTSPVYETFRCILFCHMNSAGRVIPGEMELIVADINDQIGGLGASILNSMLQIAGEGGVNNLASLGTSTGDCEDCACVPTWCYRFDFTLSDYGWAADFGTWVASSGWQGVAFGSGGGLSNLMKNYGFDLTVTSIKVHSIGSGFTAGQRQLDLTLDSDPPVAHVLSPDVNGDFVGQYNQADFVPFSFDTIQLYWGGAGSHDITIDWIEYHGEGENPFGEDNCE